MDLNFQQRKELTTAHGIPGIQAPRRGLFYKYPIPLGVLSQGEFGSVICQNNGTSEAPCVKFGELMNEGQSFAKHITKEGFINLFTRR